MFKFLKDKLSSWAKKLSETTEEVETPKEKKTEKVEKIQKKATEAKKQKKSEKKELIKEPIKKSDSELSPTPEIIEPIEETKEPEKESFFSKLTSKFHINKVKIKDEEFDIYAEELEMLLLENNVALEVSEKIIKELRKRIVGKELLKKEVEDVIKDTLKDILREILIEPFDIYDKISSKKAQNLPYVILFCGINGTGKTTTIAKIANALKKQHLSCVLAAGDTFRAASIEQLKEHGERVGVKVISHDYGSDPASVGFDAIKYAKKNMIDVVLIDTAGRMHTSKNLLEEIKKISKVTNPDLKIFVGESITGNDVIEQAKTFDEVIGIDGIVLTKADIDEKGGTALSVGYILKKPILFLGMGQEYDEIELFNRQKFIEKLGL